MLNFIAVAESTPGLIVVNMATFVGSSQGGILGAFIATIGVVLPSFIIIFVIAALINNLLKFACVKAALDGVRPSIVGLIIATALTMLLSTVFGISAAENILTFNWRAAIIFVVLAVVWFMYPKVFKLRQTCLFVKMQKRTISPIMIITLSGLMGVLLYTV